jgi:hypothetical protein
MPTNQYLAFATDPTANLETQTNYAAAESTSKGFVTGIAPSKNMNKAYRQATVPAAAIAQFICDTLGINMMDDGDVTNFKTQFMSAMRAFAGVPVGAIIGFPTTTAPTGFLKANAAAVSRATYANLDAFLYVGDSNNASAIHGYRCTDPANPSSTRSTTGAYIVLPEYRGEFIRGLDDGRGIDSGRTVQQFQGPSILSHTHSASTDTQGSHSHTGYTDAPGSHQHDSGWGESSGGPYGNARSGAQGSAATDNDNYSYYSSYAGNHTHGVTTYAAAGHTHTVTVFAAGGTENIVRNKALLYCIKY